MSATRKALQSTGDIEAVKHNHPQNTGDTGDTGDKPVTADLEASPVSDTATGDTGDKPMFPSGFKIKNGGVYFIEEGDDGDTKDIWVCSALYVTARIRNGDSEAWGRLLEFSDADGVLHTWACPMEMLAGEGLEFYRALMYMGLDIAPGRKARNLLSTYVQAAKVDARARCTTAAGWHGGAYVLPDATIGEGDERVLLQSQGVPLKARQQGTAEEWREHVGRYCMGNSRMTLGVSMAFAGPLLEFVGRESGGIHFVGGSSVGKTTIARCAVSVWGDFLGFSRHWRTTVNGLEGIARQHNDGLLVLDELAQIDPRQAGEACYMLGNGAGKTRARRDGLARPTSTWRLLFLSTGEIRLADHMAEAGKRAKAGQDVRLVDVPADNLEYGAFEYIHDCEDSGEFVHRIEQNTKLYYGAPIRRYLELLTQTSREAICERVDLVINEFVADSVPPGADGQVRRVAGRFGLIAAGGELATAMGITGWRGGDAIESARACLDEWLGLRGGTGAQEHKKAIAQVRHFLEAHGSYRFEDPDERERAIPNQAGIRRVVDGQTQYLIFPETFRHEVCAGMNPRIVCQALRDSGHLVVQEIDRNTIKPRGQRRMYGVKETIHES